MTPPATEPGDRVAGSFSTDLQDAAQQLYALPLSEFTAARNACARTARAGGGGDLAAAIGRLRKPTAAAWLVNMLVRARPADTDAVLDLGAALRLAQERPDRDAIRALGRRRQEVLGAALRAAQDLAAGYGQKMSGSVADEVEQTLQAGIADSDAAEAVRSGRLLRALSATGLEPADLSNAVAVPGGDRTGSPPGEAASSSRDRGGVDRHRREDAEARRRVAEADRRRESAGKALHAVEKRLAVAAARQEAIDRDIDDLQAALSAARARHDALDDEVHGLRREREAATKAVSKAARDLAQASSRLAGLADMTQP